GRHRAACLAALEQSARQNRGRRPSGDLAVMVNLLKANDAAVAASAARLAGLWRLENVEVRRTLISLAKLTHSPAALEGLGLMGDAESRKALIELCGISNVATTRRDAIAALAAADLRGAADQAASLMSGLPRDFDLGPLFAAFISRQGGPEVLAKALNGK